MRKLLLAFGVVAILAGCGSEAPVVPQVESTESGLVTSKTYHGSYQCGPDWWQVEQVIQKTSILVRNGATQIYALLQAEHAIDDPTANAVQLWCWPNQSPVPMAWGGISYYNTQSMGGTPSNCIMWTHRRNQPWANSATVAVNAGGDLQLYPGSPDTWELHATDAGGSGNHDGLAACGGSFLLFLQ